MHQVSQSQRKVITYIEDKWKREKKKEFVKLHISVDEKSKKVEYHLG